MFIELVVPSNHFILCHPFLLPSIFPTVRVFSNDSALHIRWSTDWNFSFGISPSIEYSGLISSRIDWFDLFAVQETLKSLLQHHRWKASIFWRSAFLMVQPSHLYLLLPLLKYTPKITLIISNFFSKDFLKKQLSFCYIHSLTFCFFLYHYFLVTFLTHLINICN